MYLLDVECFPRPPLQMCFIKTRIKQHRFVVFLNTVVEYIQMLRPSLF